MAYFQISYLNDNRWIITTETIPAVDSAAARRYAGEHHPMGFSSGLCRVEEVEDE